MNYNQLSLWPILLFVLLFFFTTVIVMEEKFFKFVKTYWFYKRSLVSYLSSVLYIVGISLLLFSLLDLRGPEEKIKTAAPTDRTIILLDTSASMLAEDVKPSRLSKAILIAKHFSRKAAGHQLSVVAFSEIQKKIVPFTNDIDLIDARLESLKNIRNQYGSSALSVAIQESVQYFIESNGEARGNILVLTDGEETSDGVKLNVPKGIYVALVGIGTSRGGRIPLDDGRGFRFGYKKVGGKDVITKLNEDFFKTTAADIPSGKYWPTNTYSLPSEEILDFFQSEKVKGNKQQDMVIKPVLMEWVVVPALILLIASYFLKTIRIFALGLFLVVMPANAEEEKIELSPDVIQRLDDFKRGELNQLERLKLADDLQKSGAKDEALFIYGENLPKEIDKNLPPEAYMNYGTTLLSKGETEKALSIYNNLTKSLRKTEKFDKMKDIMDKNIVSFFQQQEQKKKEQEKKEQEKKDNKKDQKENKDQSGNGQSQDSQSGQESKQDKKDQKDGKDEDKSEDQKDKQGKGEKEQDDKDQGEDENDSDKDTEEDSDEPKAPQKVPAKLKQLLSDDRQLQMKIIENGTKDLNRRKSRKSKDW